MKIKSFIVLYVLFGIVLLVSSTGQAETSKAETPEEYHVNNGYGGGEGSWGGYVGGGGYGGYGGYGGGGWGGWDGRGGGYGGVGWDGPGDGGGGWVGGGGSWGGGCRYGCCGRWNRYRGCSRCCRTLTEAISFNKQEASP